MYFFHKTKKVKIYNRIFKLYIQNKLPLVSVYFHNLTFLSSAAETMRLTVG